ncbi:MAG: flgA [Acidobacteria bacterium]|nr:flgA [Acidobacteriota bacterium]
MPVFAAIFITAWSGFWCLAAINGNSCSIRVRSEVAVRSPALTLADVADVSGKDDVLVSLLARMPLGTVSDVRLIRRSELVSLLTASFPDAVVDVAGADFVRVTLAKRPPDPAEIAVLLKAHLGSVTQWSEEELEIRSLGNLESVDLPAEGVELRVAGRRVPANYRGFLVPVEAVLDGRLLRTFWIKADVRVRARVVRIEKPVAYGSTLAAGDLREAVQDIENPGIDYVREIVEAVGMTARRGLGKGELLSRNSLKESSLVRSGETVRLLARSGSIVVSTLARALQNGKLGDRIKVRTMDSDRSITAVVIGRSEVQVAY